MTESFFTLSQGHFSQVTNVTPTFDRKAAFTKVRSELNPGLVTNRAKRFGITEEEARDILADYETDRLQDEVRAAFRSAWFGGTV